MDIVALKLVDIANVKDSTMVQSNPEIGGGVQGHSTSSHIHRVDAVIGIIRCERASESGYYALMSDLDSGEKLI